MDRLAALVLPLLCLAAPLLAAETGLPKPVVPDCLGVNIHFTGRSDKHVAKIAEGGFRFVRMDFFWQGIETKKGEYDFRKYDDLVGSLAERNIRPIFILDYGNPLYDDGLSPHTDEGRAAFARFAAAGVAHFKGRGVVWELWNEPNGGAFWKPIPNATDYAKLAEVVYPAVKKADPGATLIAPALAGGSFGFLEDTFRLGLLKNLDAVSVHPYGCVKPEDASAYFDTVRALIRKYAPGKSIPILSGEWGFSSCNNLTVDRQAQFIAREFINNMANGVALSIWYDWIDDGPDPKEKEHHFGTLYLDFSEKPAYKAVKTLTTQLAGYRCSARLDSGKDDHLVLFSRGDDTCLAAWTTADPHRITLPVDVTSFSSVSLLGEQSTLTARDGRLQLDLSQSVQYIKPASASKRWSLEAEWSPSAVQSLGASGPEMSVTSSIELVSPRYEFYVGGKKLQAKLASAGASYPYLTNGTTESQVRIVAHVPGLREPLIRTMTLENVCVPVVDVLPPTGGFLPLSVRLPQAATQSFQGRLSVENASGIDFQDTSAPLDLSPAAPTQLLKLRIAGHETDFAFRIRISSASRVVAVSPIRRYTVVETFSDGKPGDPAPGYNALVGETEPPGEARLTYVRPADSGPGPVCGRIDYHFDAGWQWLQVVPKTRMAFPKNVSAVKVWIKGQGNGSAVLLRYLGSDGQTHNTRYGTLGSSGWEVLTANVEGGFTSHWGGSGDGIARPPLTWESILVIENQPRKAITGEVYVGPIMLCYGD